MSKRKKVEFIPGAIGQQVLIHSLKFNYHNYQMIEVSYEYGEKVTQIEIPAEQAISMGLINLDVLNEYCNNFK